MSAEVERIAYSVPEAAAALGCSPDLVRRLIADGALPTVPTGTRRHLIPVDALRRFANSTPHRAAAAPDTAPATAGPVGASSGPPAPDEDHHMDGAAPSGGPRPTPARLRVI